MKASFMPSMPTDDEAACATAAQSRGSVVCFGLKFIIARPELLKVVVRPFMTNHWGPGTRLVRLLDHIATARATLGAAALPNNSVTELVHFDLNGVEYRLTLDHARWLALEGPLVFSLWESIDRVFHISFCLSSEAGRKIAYVGGIQGRSTGDALDRYRDFTRAAHGMRPRDFLVESFKSFCASVGVNEIRAVTNQAYRSAWARESSDEVKLDYDAIWRERGGVARESGFFTLKPVIHKRSPEEIPAKKRSQYRQRYAFLDQVDRELAMRLMPAKVTSPSRQYNKWSWVKEKLFALALASLIWGDLLSKNRRVAVVLLSCMWA